MFPFRFIHASGLRLEQTIEGVSNLPPSLEERLLDISYRAAERVFEAAIMERVDFLVLSGDILDPLRTGPPGPLFLIGQFEKLEAEGIDVYWVGGEFDSPEDWPPGFTLPENVHLFSGDDIREYVVHRNGDALARLIGIRRKRQGRRLQTAELAPDAADLFTIVVANGSVDPEGLSERRIHYWALGGKSHRQTYYGNRTKTAKTGNEKPAKGFKDGTANETKPDKNHPLPYIVHYPGAPVGRNPDETGVYGVTLVEVPEDGEPLLTLIPTAPLRWIEETVRLEPDDDTEQLSSKLRERIKSYRSDQNKTHRHGGEVADIRLSREGAAVIEAAADYDLVIRWTVEGANGTLAHHLRRGTLSADLLSELRGVYAKEESDAPLLWSLSIELPTSDTLHAGQYEQKTILGDYLRLARHHQQHPEEPIDLVPLVPSGMLDDPITEKLLLHSRREGEAEETTPVQTSAQTATQMFVQTPAQKRAQAQAVREAALLGRDLLGGDKRSRSDAAGWNPAEEY
ncbi:MAG TPA: hypothetical protein DEB39_07355 [Planctomycetaceae bacterium]|nr:hypothetical protein [Planctomycetaceae bacterium]